MTFRNRMRKIQTLEETERKTKIKKRIGSIVLLGILVISTLGYAFISNPFSDNKENIDEVENQDRVGTDRISLKYEGSIFSLLSSYDDVEKIPVEITAKPNDYFGEVLYIASDNDGITQELGSNIGKFASRIQRACYGKCDDDLPEKNCTTNLFIWKEANESKVYQKDKCVFIEGDMRAADAFIYKLFSEEIK